MINNIIACVFCCGRDSDMLAPFIRGWRNCYDVDLVLMNDVTDSVKDTYGLKSYPSYWSSAKSQSGGVIASLALVAASCDAVIKLDVDCVHQATTPVPWFDDYNLNCVAMGIQHGYIDKCFYGACYIVRSDVIANLSLSGDADGSSFEDRKISRTLQSKYSSVKLVPRDSGVLRGFSPSSDYSNTPIIHFGQNQPRNMVASSMSNQLDKNL